MPETRLAGISARARVAGKPYLRREIFIALLLKFAAIYVLWSLFFSHPIDEHLNGKQVSESVFGAANTAPFTSQLHNSLHNTEENKR